MEAPHAHGVNVERFARLLAKRWKRNRSYAARDLSELKSLSGYSEALYPHHQREVCQAIERRARQILESTL